jgi:hypothetical protein
MWQRPERLLENRMKKLGECGAPIIAMRLQMYKQWKDISNAAPKNQSKLAL